MDTSISIIVAGGAGQGIQTIEQLVVRMAKNSARHVFATKEFMSRIRGGSNSTQIRIHSQPVQAPLERIDIAVVLDRDALGHIEKRCSENTLLIGDKETIGHSDFPVFHVALSSIAKDLGDKVYANTVAVGCIARLVGIEQEVAFKSIEDFFKGKSPDLIAHNKEAWTRGYNACAQDKQDERIRAVTRDKMVLEDILVNGAEAVGLGAICGGCDFVCSYPMSPATGVLVFLSQHASEFKTIVEQVEDEISAVNMALGAWYAGARALVTTSGGGFALMCEGISLSGITETPLVVHVAQRPGPGTGLPTRTEQGDLNLVLYAGHGEFPRAIFAPGDLADAFTIARQAFAIADKHQVPVFILTDQYLMDTYYNTLPFPVPKKERKRHVVKTKRNYNRYRLTSTGISPRGIPGYGEGLVKVDSDEHDEQGQITESMVMRTAQVNKRLAKKDGLVKDILLPSFEGMENSQTLIVSWGSTRRIVSEALKIINNTTIGHIHFSQVYPLSTDTASYFHSVQHIIVVENNATAQFARLLTQELDIVVDVSITKYNGLPFYVEELVEKISMYI